MILLALDPSSTCTGYAVMESAEDIPRMIEAGKLTGKNIKPATARVLSMRDDLLALLDEARPAVVVIELPMDKQYTRTAGKRSGLPVWAGAAWAIWMTAVAWVDAQPRVAYLNPLNGGTWTYIKPCHVHPVSNTEWTRGSSKESRKAWIGATYASYNPADDPGGDVSDAAALGLWWHARNKEPLHGGDE